MTRAPIITCSRCRENKTGVDPILWLCGDCLAAIPVEMRSVERLAKWRLIWSDNARNKASLDSTARLLTTGHGDNLSLSDALRQCVGVLEDMRGDFVEPYFNARLKALTHAYAALGVSGPFQQEQTSHE